MTNYRSELQKLIASFDEHLGVHNDSLLRAVEEARASLDEPVPAPPAEGEVAELVAFLLWHASGLGHYGHGKRGRLLLTRAAHLLEQRYPASVPTPPAEGEVADLVDWLCDEADQFQDT